MLFVIKMDSNEIINLLKSKDNHRVDKFIWKI